MSRASSSLLRYAADRRMLGMVGAWFAFEAYLWSTPIGHPLVTAACVAVACAGAFLGAVATHNTVHCPVFHARWLNNLWHVALTLTYGHPVSSYVPGHNLSHHRHTESARDVMRTDKARFGYNLFNLLFFASSVGPSILRAEVAYTRFARARRPRWTRQLVVETVAWLAVTVALVALDWRKALLYVVIPWQYAAWGIITMNLLQHDGCDARSPWNHSRNFVNGILNWFTFNNGYHTIHHLAPTLHWSLAPEEHRRVVVPRIDPRLDEPSLFAYLLRAYLLPGGRRNFDGTPRVPAPVGVDEPWFTQDGPLPATAAAVTLADGLPPRRAQRR